MTDYYYYYPYNNNYSYSRRPDLIVVDKHTKSASIIDIAIPGDKRILEKEREKIEKYQGLKREIRRLWNLKRIEVIPIVLGALGSVSKNLVHYISKLGIEIDITQTQKTALLGTARILRKVLEY